MVTIGNANPMLALVRAQLERLARTKGARTPATSTSSPATGAAPQGGLRGLAGLADLPEDAFRRALVGALLTEEFGEEVAADPRFQSVIDRAAEMMRDDPRLVEIAADLRGG